MERQRIAGIFADSQSLGGQEMTVCGWVRTVRDMKNFGFIELNDGSCFKSLQVVFERETLENYEEIAKQNVGAALIVKGTLVLTPEAKQPFELKAREITVEGASTPDYPLQKKRHSVEFLRTIQHLRPRTNLFSAVFRVRSVAAQAVHEFFQSRGFVYLQTPIITGSDCEGAGEMFRVTTLDLNNLPRKEDGTVDDSKDEGWMRDYVVTTKQKISAPTPSDTAEESAAVGEETADSTETSANQEVIATAKTNRAANLRQTMGGKVLVQLKKGTKVNIYEQTTDKKGNVWYKAQAQNGEKVGYLRDYVVTLDKGAGTTGSGASTATAAEDLQDREVIGKATTNRAANVREEPLANATVVRQLGNGMELQILAKYAGVKEETWYEVVTASGKTHGFVRDYVVYVTKLDKNAPTLTYEK